jgi:hypothetical protein
MGLLPTGVDQLPSDFFAAGLNSNNRRMHIDHLVFAAGPEGLEETVARLQDKLGARFKQGGVHPRFGTRNMILPLADDRYLEAVEVLDHPVADKVPYGKAVRDRSEAGGGWLAWAISVPSLTPFEKRFATFADPGTRVFPDGRRLNWKQLGFRGQMADPQLPYLLHWESEPDVLPSALPGTIGVTRLDIAGSHNRVEKWLGQPVGDTFDGVEILWAAENGHPGLNAVTFESPKRGTVRI